MKTGFLGLVRRCPGGDWSQLKGRKLYTKVPDMACCAFHGPHIENSPFWPKVVPDSTVMIIWYEFLVTAFVHGAQYLYRVVLFHSWLYTLVNAAFASAREAKSFPFHVIPSNLGVRDFYI